MNRCINPAPTGRLSLGLPHMNSLLILSLCAAAVGDDTFARFEKWSKQYRAAEGEYQRAALLSDGVELAHVRRGLMLELIRNDPARALERRASRDGMPEAVA